MPIAISMAVTAAVRRAQLRKADLNTTFVQQKKSCRVAHAHARSVRHVYRSFSVCFLILSNLKHRIQDTSQKKSARRLVTLKNGLEMAIAMTRITRVDAIGMEGIAAATTGISNSAHTACAKIRSMQKGSSEYG